MHLRTAAAIERLFSGRLNEFYGMLALHYTYGAAYDKAEAYLALAGTEALKSAASGEAIHYYQDALNAYIRHAGENADPERKAHFERNIGLAFYTKGYMAKAVEHFDRALALWGVPIPRNATLRQIRLVRDLTSVLVRLYIVRRHRCEPRTLVKWTSSKPGTKKVRPLFPTIQRASSRRRSQFCDRLTSSTSVR
jgi:tetratricopeptide (TPR) repeat protein